MNGFRKLVQPLRLDVQTKDKDEDEDKHEKKCETCQYLGMYNLTLAEIEKLQVKVELLTKEAHDVTSLRTTNEKLTELMANLNDYHFSYIHKFEDLQFETMRASFQEFKQTKEGRLSRDYMRRENTYKHQEIRKQDDIYQLRCDQLQRRAELALKEIKGRMVLETKCEELDRLNRFLSMCESQLRQDLEAKTDECNDLKLGQARLKEVAKRNEDQLGDTQSTLFVRETKSDFALHSAKEKINKKEGELLQRCVELKLSQEMLLSSRVAESSWKEKHEAVEIERYQMQKLAEKTRSEYHEMEQELRRTKVLHKTLEVEARKLRAEASKMKKKLTTLHSEGADAKKRADKYEKLASTLQNKVNAMRTELNRARHDLEEERARIRDLQLQKKDLNDRYKTANAILYDRLHGTLQLTEIEKECAKSIWKGRWNQCRCARDSQPVKSDRPMTSTVPRQSLDSVVKEKSILDENEELKKQLKDLRTELVLAKDETSAALRVSNDHLAVMKKEVSFRVEPMEKELKKSIEEIRSLRETLKKVEAERDILRESALPSATITYVESPPKSRKVVFSSGRSKMGNYKGMPGQNVTSTEKSQGRAQAKVSKSGILPSSKLLQPPFRQRSEEEKPATHVLDFNGKSKTLGHSPRSKNKRMYTTGP